MNSLQQRNNAPRHAEMDMDIGTLRTLAENAAKDGDAETAAELWCRIIALRPRDAIAYYKYGNALKNLAQLSAALENYDTAISLDPSYSNAFCNRGVVLEQLGRIEDAAESYQSAIVLNPGDALSQYNRGTVLVELGRLDEALQSFDAAIAIAPNYAEALCNRGNVLKELKRWDAALADYDRSIEIHPGFAEAYFNRGLLRQSRKEAAAALADLDKAVEINPRHVTALWNRGVLLGVLQQWDAALASIDAAIAIAPECVEAHFNRAEALVQMKRPAAAVESYDRVSALAPTTPYLIGNRLFAKLNVCDWRSLDADLQRLTADFTDKGSKTVPFHFLALTDDPSLQERAARSWVTSEYPPDETLPSIVQDPADRRIRLGYFSADFGNHPVSLLAAELFETHDRSRFDVIAFSFGPAMRDPMRARLERAFDRFIDVSGMTDEEAALLARSLGIDIAIDLGGHTGGARTGIFALRAAPIQINYLGYLGTMGADYMDYVIADRTVITAETEPYFTEKIIYLPDTFQVNDRKREISPRVFRREELGLPANGFVFCCFNSSYKILPATFASWMRILTRVPGSVLMLVAGDGTLEANLRAQAEQHGVEANRLVFAGRLPPPEYLARYRAADLFLDTLPYNAGATASDALWAGLPVLTCLGKTFAGRMAASLLKAIELPELITHTRQEYEELAVTLAANPARLAAIKSRLEKNTSTSPLFDTTRFTRTLEKAYIRMSERYHLDLNADHIEV